MFDSKKAYKSMTSLAVVPGTLPLKSMIDSRRPEGTQDKFKKSLKHFPKVKQYHHSFQPVRIDTI